MFGLTSRSVLLISARRRRVSATGTRATLSRVTLVVVLAAATVLGQPPTPAAADGTEWEAIATPPAGSTDYQWKSVAYGDGVWIAVASTQNQDRLMRSVDDGRTWQEVTAEAADDNQWQSVAYGNGVWVAVSQNGTNRAMRSTDRGVTWQALGTDEGVENLQWRSVAYGNEVWVAVTASRVMRSTNDGQTWTSETVGAPRWSSVAYGDGVWVAVNMDSTDQVMRSTNDGVTWVSVTAPQSNRRTSVAYGGDGVWIAVSSDGNSSRVMRSTNEGVTWEATSVDLNSWQSVAFGNGVWVAVSLTTSATNQVMRSEDDGDTWTPVAAAEANRWRSVAYGNGVWIAVSSDGTNRVMRSGAPLPAPQLQSAAAVQPSVSCLPEAPVAEGVVACTVTGGEPGVDILWRAAYNPTFAGEGVTLDASGTGTFSFTVPAVALGEELTVELVEWTAPVSLGVVAGPVPSSVPSGEGPVPVWTLGLAALAGIGVLRRGMRVEA